MQIRIITRQLRAIQCTRWKSNYIPLHAVSQANDSLLISEIHNQGNSYTTHYLPLTAQRWNSTLSYGPWIGPSMAFNPPLRAPRDAQSTRLHTFNPLLVAIHCPRSKSNYVPLYSVGPSMTFQFVCESPSRCTVDPTPHIQSSTSGHCKCKIELRCHTYICRGSH